MGLKCCGSNFEMGENVMKHSHYSPVKMVEYDMKVVERAHQKSTWFASINKIQFGFMFRKGTIHAVFTLRFHEEERGKKLVQVFCRSGEHLYKFFPSLLFMKPQCKHSMN